MQRTLFGNQLSPEDQRYVLSAYVHRYTREHVPEWAKNRCPDGTPYSVQFASDQEWLANTRFAATKFGALDYRYQYCHSNPTWPDSKPIAK